MPFPLNYHFECILKLFEIGTRTLTKQNEERKKKLESQERKQTKTQYRGVEVGFQKPVRIQDEC